MEEAFDHFTYYWEHLTLEERKALKKITDEKNLSKEDNPELRDLEQKALIHERQGKYSIFSAAFERFVRETEFSEVKEQMTTFLTRNTKTLILITKYCLDKAVELKK